VQAKVGTLITDHGALRVRLHWNAAEHAGLFPVMDCELRISEVAGDQIELRLVCEYEAPLGAVKAVADAAAGEIATRLPRRGCEKTRDEAGRTRRPSQRRAGSTLRTAGKHTRRTR
jgi:hypothetical protein